MKNLKYKLHENVWTKAFAKIHDLTSVEAWVLIDIKLRQKIRVVVLQQVLESLPDNLNEES